ncbi:MAG: phage integrase SAM-like domain-containing protein [Petrimonas sp.]|nr:phage integrase SAM-like domain-containing protein [Petrimonas sp.]
MATIQAFIRTTKRKTDSVNIRFRLRDGRNIQLFHTSEFTIDPEVWDDKKQAIKAKVIYPSLERKIFNDAVNERKRLIGDIYSETINKEALTSDMLDIEIDKKINPHKYPELKNKHQEQTFFEAFDEFLNKRKLSTVRINNFKVIKRALQRYEIYKKYIRQPIILTFDNITSDTLIDIENFMRNEHQYYIDYPDIYAQIPEKRTPQKRGQNTINDIFTKIRTFILWAIKEKKTTNNPFENYTVEECVYGTPYYISIDERNTLYNADLTKRPQLAIQRDIFVFQCLIGCRVGDMYKMTKDNVMNGAIEYVARKTKENRPITVRVPLNSIALEILDRYPDCPKLLPFISEQKYNDAIKDMFLIAGLTRLVTVINPTTREEEKKPLNEIASSHIARRSFVGNLYKQVKDPSLVGSLSGHKEGSKAFARYRDIDDDMKKELVDLLI